jgi:uncharacterized protein (TIRG00374 family)
MQKKSRFRWVLTTLRYGLCVAAVIFLYNAVNWYDRVDLADGTTVRLFEQHGDTLVIDRNGERTTILLDQVAPGMLQDGALTPKPGIRGVVRELDIRMALLAIALFAPVWFIQSYRLVLMVAIQGVKLSYWNAVKLTFAGNFFNFALPGTTGGDLIKAYYITHYTHQKTEVVTTIFLDRAIGLFSIIVIATTCILLNWDAEKFSSLVGVLILIFAALLVGAVFVFSARLRHAIGLPRLAAKLPGSQQILRIGRATVAMRAHLGKSVAALLLSILLQSIVMVSAAVMAWALGMQGSLLYFFIYVAIGFLVAAVPSTPQAVGVMESAYVLFFTPLNTASQAVALALAVRLIQLVWAIPGVLVPLLGAHRPSKVDLLALEAEAEAQRQAAAEPLTPDSTPAIDAAASK